jgi:hypothetical protein
MQDAEKPRRSRSEALAEIADRERRAHATADAQMACAPVNPPLSALVAQMEANEEAEYRARESAETLAETKESAQIVLTEIEISIETPILRERELRRTFSGNERVHAATAAD